MPSELQRPLPGVVLISALQLFVAVYMLLISFQMAQGHVSRGASREVLGTLASGAPYLAVLAILPAALSVGLYLMANWARALALILYGLWLFECVFSWFNLLLSDAHDVKNPTILFNALLVRTAFHGCIVIYLMRPKVVRAFHEAY